jgi:hypothetical protein
MVSFLLSKKIFASHLAGQRLSSWSMIKNNHAEGSPPRQEIKPGNRAQAPAVYGEADI